MLLGLALGKALVTEAGVHEHEQDEVGLFRDVLDSRQGRVGVEDDPGSAAQVLDALGGPMPLVSKLRSLAFRLRLWLWWWVGRGSLAFTDMAARPNPASAAWADSVAAC